MLIQTFTVCSALALAVSSTSDPSPVPPPPAGWILPPALPDCSCANGTHAECLATVDKWWPEPWPPWPESACAKQCLDGAGNDGRTARRLTDARDKCMADFSQLVNECMLQKTRAGTSGCVGDTWDGAPAPPADWLDMGHAHVDAAVDRLYSSMDYVGCMSECTLPDPTGMPPPMPADGEPYHVPFAHQCGCIAYFDYNKCEREVAEHKYAGAPPTCACVAEAVPEANLDCSAPPPTPPPPPPMCQCADATQAACVKAQTLASSEPPPAPPLPPCHKRCAEQTAGYEQMELLDAASDKCYRRHDQAIADCMNGKIKEGSMGCADPNRAEPSRVRVPNGGEKVWAHRQALETRIGLAQCLEQQCYALEPPPLGKRSVAPLTAHYQPPFVEQCGCFAPVDYSACESEMQPDSICHCVAEEVTGLDCKQPVPTSGPIFLHVKK